MLNFVHNKKILSETQVTKKLISLIYIKRFLETKEKKINRKKWVKQMNRKNADVPWHIRRYALYS